MDTVAVRRGSTRCEDMSLSELRSARTGAENELEAAQNGYGDMKAAGEKIDQIDALIEQREQDALRVSESEQTQQFEMELEL